MRLALTVATVVAALVCVAGHPQNNKLRRNLQREESKQAVKVPAPFGNVAVSNGELAQVSTNNDYTDVLAPGVEVHTDENNDEITVDAWGFHIICKRDPITATTRCITKNEWWPNETDTDIDNNPPRQPRPVEAPEPDPVQHIYPPQPPATIDEPQQDFKPLPPQPKPVARPPVDAPATDPAEPPQETNIPPTVATDPVPAEPPTVATDPVPEPPTVATDPVPAEPPATGATTNEDGTVEQWPITDDEVTTPAAPVVSAPKKVVPTAPEKEEGGEDRWVAVTPQKKYSKEAALTVEEEEDTTHHQQQQEADKYRYEGDEEDDGDLGGENS